MLNPGAKESPSEYNRKQGDQTDAEMEGTAEVDTRLKKKSVTNTVRDYTVDGIVLHVENDYNVKYVVGWYAYTPAYDTLNRLPTCTSISLLAIGAWCGNNMQCHHKREPGAVVDKNARHALYKQRRQWRYTEETPVSIQCRTRSCRWIVKEEWSPHWLLCNKTNSNVRNGDKPR